LCQAACAAFLLCGGCVLEDAQNLRPDLRLRINQLEVSCRRGDEFDVFASDEFAAEVGGAEVVRNRFIVQAVDENLAGANGEFHGIGVTITIGKLRGRAAQEFGNGVVAEVQLPGTLNVNNTAQRDDMTDASVGCSEAEGKVAAGGVTGDTDTRGVEVSAERMLAGDEEIESATEVVECAGPAAPRISGAAVLDVPGGNTCSGQRVTKVPGVSKIVLGAPESAVNEEDNRVGSRRRGQADIGKMVRIGTVGEPMARARDRAAENVFVLHASSIARSGLA